MTIGLTFCRSKPGAKQRPRWSSHKSHLSRIRSVRRRRSRRWWSRWWTRRRKCQRRSRFKLTPINQALSKLSLTR